MVPEIQDPDRSTTLRLSVVPDLVSARAAAATVRGFFAEQGVPDQELFACELCVAEACNNAIEYAGAPGRDLPVSVDAMCGPRRIELRVSDHTPGFDMPEPPPTAPNMDSDRGRGLFIIRSLMDEVHYLRGATENVLVMSKQLVGGLSNMPGELDMARVIQRSLLPVTLPQLPGFSLAGAWKCAREVGGDFYDAISLGDHTTLLMIADVMGKGVPAALFATNLRGLLRGLSARYHDPAMLLERLNGLLYEDLYPVGMFITAQVAVVDVRARLVTTAGAGHGPLLHVSERGLVEPLATQGMPLGAMPEARYESQTAALGRPGTLLLHTDGLVDMRNAEGETYGMPRLLDWLRSNIGRGRSATELRGRLMAELKRFRGGTPMTDDQAFLLLTEDPLL